MQALRHRFSGLRTRLTLTYTLVTVGALLALLIVLLSGVFALIVASGANTSGYIGDIRLVLGFRAADYLLTEDVDGLQNWMERRYASGFASDQPLNFLDSPAAEFANAYDFYVLDVNGRILAQAPAPTNLGEPVTLPDGVTPDWYEEQRTNDLFFYPNAQTQPLADGNWFVVLPLHNRSEYLGAMVMTVTPAPPFLRSNLPLIGAIVGVATIALLFGVAPFGAIFGYIMARNLTGRLAKLETAAEAWSKGDFHVTPEDQSGDEIGRLANRLKQMAQQIETLLHTRQDLALLEERNRLARELHDTVKQQNFATLMQVRAAKNLAQQERKPEVAMQHLETAESLLKQSQEDLKIVIAELRPVQLEGRGLPAALKQYVQAWSAQNSVAATVSVETERPLSLDLEQPLYRVAQEALANIARHSQATAVELSLTYQPDAVTLRIVDNGQGFDLTHEKRGFGLSTMHQRIAELGGHFTIESEVGTGTAVTATINLNHQHANQSYLTPDTHNGTKEQP